MIRVEWAQPQAKTLPRTEGEVIYATGLGWVTERASPRSLRVVSAKAGASLERLLRWMVRA